MLHMLLNFMRNFEGASVEVLSRLDPHQLLEESSAGK